MNPFAHPQSVGDRMGDSDRDEEVLNFRRKEEDKSEEEEESSLSFLGGREEVLIHTAVLFPLDDDSVWIGFILFMGGMDDVVECDKK